MAAPQLTFACELETPALQELITDRVIADLVDLGAAVSLAIIDLSAGRAEVIRRLNAADVPVIAWLLLPKDQGYYFNIHNAFQADKFYDGFRAWSQAEDLRFAALGIDIEPELRDLTAFFGADRWRSLPRFLARFFQFAPLRRSRQIYTNLIARMHADGYLVESYQFPFIADERLAGTSLVQRLTGLIDLPVDREVWMLYSSFFRPNSAALLASYAPEADVVGLGITGGGVSEPGLPQFAPLSWSELERDLRLAWNWRDQIFIFSLEGCVQNGYLDRLKTFHWDAPILLPQTLQVDAWRRSLWSGLWLAEKLPLLLAGAAAAFVVLKRRRRRSFTTGA